MKLVAHFAGCMSLSLGIAFGLAGCGHKKLPIAVTAAPGPDLEPRAEQEAKAAAKDGHRFSEALRGVGQEDEYTDWRIPLEAGQCYWFGYAGDAGVQRFSMYIFDPTDKRLDSARGKPRQGVFQHCALLNGMYRVQGKVAEGGGHYAVVVYSGKAPAVVLPPGEVKADLVALIEKQVASAAPGATRVGEYFAGSAETSEWYTQMEAGKCYWVVGAGEPGKVKRLYVYLWDPKSKRITENKSDSEISMVGHCAKEAGMYKFQAKVDSGKGDYKVGVFAK